MPRRNLLSQFLVDLLENPAKAVATTGPKVLQQRYPEAAVAMQVATALAARGRKTLFGGASGLDGIGSPLQAVEEIKKRKVGMVPIVIGVPGGGKTNWSIFLARQVGNKHNFALGMKDSQLPKDFVMLHSIDQIFSLPKGSTIILDDLGQIASLYMSKNRDRQEVLDLVGQARHLGILMIINCQNSRQIQPRWMDTIEFCFIKRPILNEEGERTILRKAYRRAIAAFMGHMLDIQWIYDHVYVYSLYGEGVLEFHTKEVY